MKSKSHITVGNFLKIFPTFVFLFSLSLQMRAEEHYKKPEFAFPQQVEKGSEELLNHSLQTGDDLMALRALMNVCVARNLLLNNESVESNIYLADTVASRLRGYYKSLALLIEAQILSQEYEWNKGLYTQRNLPLDENYPENPADWSGEMFKNKILSLIENATEDIDINDNISLSTVRLLLENYEFGDKYGFTLSDFIIFNSISLLESFGTSVSSSIIPFYPLSEINTVESRANIKAKELLDSLIKKNIESNSVIAALGFVDLSKFLPEEERKDFLQKSIAMLKGKEGQAIVIFEYWNHFAISDNKDEKEFYSWAIQSLQEFPQGAGASKMQYIKERLSVKNISLSLPNNVLPNEKFEINTVISNLRESYILIYKLNDSQITEFGGLIPNKLDIAKTPFKILKVAIEELPDFNIPFKFNKNVEIDGLPSGIYAVIPSLSNSLKKDWFKNNGGVSTLNVSSISILTTNNLQQKDSGKIYVVSSRDQKPISGATVYLYKGSSRKNSIKLITGEEGSVKAPSGYYFIEARYGNNIAKTESYFHNNEPNNTSSNHISILSDLSIYRPGDEVQFVMVGWQQSKQGISLIKNKTVEAVLLDANYTKIETISLSLNEEGRAKGKFLIPQGLLLGNYQIQASLKENPNQVIGYHTFEVTDYKLPPFEVKVNEEHSDNPHEIFFKGYAQTYSGMPVSGVPVRFTIEFTPWRWGWIRSSVHASYNTTGETGKDGEFELKLPTENLQGTIFEKGIYTLKAEVISSTGEQVASSPLIFYLGKGYRISPSIPEKLEIVNDKVNFHVPVYDMAGLPVKVIVEYVMENQTTKEVVKKGTFESPLLSLESEDLQSGFYNLEFKIQGQEDRINRSTVLWRKTEEKAPYPTPLWIPENEYIFSQDEQEISVKFGSYYNDWILCLISNENEVLEERWIEPSSELTNLKIPINDVNSTYFIDLCGMHDYEAKSDKITLVPQKSREKMKIDILTFRENINAGSEENWRFQFKINEENVPDVNAFAVMTDKALNSLSDFKWNFDVWRFRPYSIVNINVPYQGSLNYTRGFSKEIRYPQTQFNLPNWETYGYTFVSPNWSRNSNRILYKSASKIKSEQMSYDTVSEESLDDAEIIEEPQMELSESVMTSGNSFEEEDLNNTTNQLRPIELPLVFFKTDLSSNDDGIVDIDFLVPDFNTTWQFQILGYNEELQNASIILDAVASKSVMVKSNLPQFLRTGDMAEISVLIFNNSQNVIPIKGIIEILNPDNNELIARKEFDSVNIKPSDNVLKSLSFEVPDKINRIAVRCYAKGDDSSDGEQGFISILPSSTPVIQAETFYADSSEETIEIKLPKFKKNSNVTLKYCDNPIWESLLALPSLKENNNGSALSVVRSLYATMMANNIIKSHPEISQRLEDIFNSEDSTLSVSKLQKDGSLKIVGLQSTPWVNNAASETNRIQSLEEYLSDIRVKNEVESLKISLKKLQQPDGGWCWFEGFKSSPFITLDVINVLSYLSEAGLWDEELKSMALKAVKYYDKYLVDLRKRNLHISLDTRVMYLYSRGLITGSWNSEIKNIKQETLKEIVNNWQYGNLAAKSVEALIMLREKEYKKDAEMIIQSIPEFLGKQHPLFELAWALILFNKVDPEGDTAARLRELIYLQKETQDWGSNPYTAGIIHALIKSTPDKVYHRTVPEIYIEGDLLKIPENQNLIGDFTIDLEGRDLSGKTIIIKRDSGIPAWGGVISQFIVPINEIKAKYVDNLKIEKQIYVLDAEGKSKKTTEFKKGDKVQVVLNVYCGKDMDYVALIDQRAACLQPVEQLSGLTFIDGALAYREVRTNSTSFFIENLKAGNYVISYDCYVERDGDYASSIATVQSLYSPSQVANSAGKEIKVKP